MCVSVCVCVCVCVAYLDIISNKIITIVVYQVVVGSRATLSVVGTSGADPYSNYQGNEEGAGGVIQIIASSGVIYSGATMKLQKGNRTCKHADKFPEDGFLLIKGIDNISAINTAFIRF